MNHAVVQIVGTRGPLQKRMVRGAASAAYPDHSVWYVPRGAVAAEHPPHEVNHRDLAITSVCYARVCVVRSYEDTNGCLSHAQSADHFPPLEINRHHLITFGARHERFVAVRPDQDGNSIGKAVDDFACSRGHPNFLKRCHTSSLRSQFEDQIKSGRDCENQEG